MTKLPRPSGTALDEVMCNNLAEQAVADLPDGSANVQIVGQKMNSIRINSKDTFLVTLSYTVGGVSFGRAVMFMNREKDQIRFQFSSQLQDFPQLQSAFLRSHCSWRNLQRLGSARQDSPWRAVG